MFGHDGHPYYIPNLGHYPLIVNPVIGNARLIKVLMDRGSGLNILYAKTLDLMGISRSQLRADTASFHGVLLGQRATPLGLLRISGGKPSPLRLSGSMGPTIPFWGDHATQSSWPSPTTSTSS
jgi:hypothetical protein